MIELGILFPGKLTEPIHAPRGPLFQMFQVTLIGFLLYQLFQGSWALPVGFKTSISQTGLNYLKDVGMQVLEQRFGTVTIPDQQGEADTPIGKIDWNIKGLVMDHITFPATSLKIEPGLGKKFHDNG